MPYLNWKASRLSKRVSPGSNGDHRFVLELDLGREDARELATALSGTFAPGQGELRADLPDEWIIFWKWRESESRLLLAHPQQEEWVATVALEPEHGARFLERLEQACGGEPGRSRVAIGELGAIGSVSNVEIVITVLG